MITYLNQYSTKLAQLTSPLRDLTEKNTHFKWEEQHQTALDKFKEELCSVLQCDASQEGLGTWIRQIDSDSNERIIVMSSQTLTDTEKRYSNIECECLAVAYALHKFGLYLLGHTTITETDHSPLELIFKRSPWKTTKTPAEMLLIQCSGEIQTRKDDSCRGHIIKSLFRQVTTNPTQQSSLCYRHTLPYQHQCSEVCISTGPGHDQAKGHHLQRIACPQERMPT